MWLKLYELNEPHLDLPADAAFFAERPGNGKLGVSVQILTRYSN